MFYCYNKIGDIMAIKNNHEYRKMMSIDFNNKKFAVFMDDYCKLAFLEITEEGKYKYPQLKDVLLLTEVFYRKELGVQPIMFENKHDKVEKVSFIPKVFINGSLVLLTASLLTGCGTFAQHDGQYYVELAQQQRVESQQTNNAIENEENVSEVRTSGLSEEEIEEKYLKYLSPADDEYDYKWANDYQSSEYLNYEFARDSKSYEKIFGFSKPTLQDLNNVIDSNSNLDAKYKTFLKEFANDWLTLYPNSDMSVFYHNLKTLKVEELSSEQIMMTAMSSGVAACYVGSENKICLNKEANVFDKSSNDYVVFVHEILHSARGTKSEIDGKSVRIGFSETLDYGLYEDEALVTYFALQLQGMNNKAIYYSLQSSYFRQLMPLVDYDGNDYMNHSVNYFEEKIQEAFDKNGIEMDALHYLNLMDSQALAHYKASSNPDYSDFSELYKVQVQLYGLQHLNSDMSYEETEQEFDTFWEDITYNFESLTDPYPTMLKEQYKPFWDEYVNSLGISNSKSL